MAIKIETLADGSTSVELSDLDAWDEFAADNEDAISERYGSKDNAYRHLCDGGLTLGGGAAPEVGVYFEM